MNSDVICDIKNKQSKLKSKKEQAENLNYESDLILKDIIDDIKHRLSYSSCNIFYGFKAELLNKAWRYFHRKGNDLSGDKEKMKEYKMAYKIVVDTIKSDILKNNADYELKHIVDYWFGTAYEFEYKYKDEVIRIDIPVFSSANKENYQYLLCGYRVFIQESKNCYTEVISGLDPNEVADRLEKMFAESEEDANA